MHDKCVKHPYQYCKDLPIIAVAELWQQGCFAGYEHDAYENIISLKREDRHFLIDKLIEVFDRGFDSGATRVWSAYQNVDDGKLNVYLWEGKNLEAPFRFILSLGLSEHTTASGIGAFVDIAYAQKDISPAIFEKLSGLPKGFKENVADDSRFMRDDMGVPDLISLRNSNKHSEFINCYIGSIMASLTSL